MKSRIHECELCGHGGMPLTRHHLIPRTCHGNRWFRKNFDIEDMRRRAVMVCRACHKAIHVSVPTEKELGRKWNTRQLLLSHPLIHRHIEWMRRRRRTA